MSILGLEVAEALRKLGMQVTIVEKKDRMLPLLDGKSHQAHLHLAKHHLRQRS